MWTQKRIQVKEREREKMADLHLFPLMICTGVSSICCHFGSFLFPIPTLFSFRKSICAGIPFQYLEWSRRRLLRWRNVIIVHILPSSICMLRQERLIVAARQLSIFRLLTTGRSLQWVSVSHASIMLFAHGERFYLRDGRGHNCWTALLFMSHCSSSSCEDCFDLLNDGIPAG